VTWERMLLVNLWLSVCCCQCYYKWTERQCRAQPLDTLWFRIYLFMGRFLITQLFRYECKDFSGYNAILRCDYRHATCTVVVGYMYKTSCHPGRYTLGPRSKRKLCINQHPALKFCQLPYRLLLASCHCGLGMIELLYM
jgi:hypothetical protein